MSRLGRRPIPIPSGVTVTVADSTLGATGPKGTLTLVIPSAMTVTVHDQTVVVRPMREPVRSKESLALWGTIWSLVRNTLTGVSQGYVRKLELQGIGYRAEVSAGKLTLFLGFSHPVEVVAPPDITFAVEKNVITVSGPSKYLVGEVAAAIRRLRPPEPYKGKGVRYQGEVVRRKAGKVAGAGTTGA